jgi:hypothetical protein
MLLLFESNEMSYFDGLEKVYSDDLIDKLTSWDCNFSSCFSGFHSLRNFTTAPPQRPQAFWL